MTIKILSLGIIGPGLVGSEFLNQIFQYQLKSKKFQFHIVAIANSRQMILGNKIENDWNPLLLDSKQPFHVQEFVNHVAQFEKAVIVDCTASQSIADLYPLFIEKGCHLITPNKKAFSGKISVWENMFDLAAQKQVGLFFESTVGAGLPVIQTLKDLIETGDEIIQIEGIFSGTLSFLFNTFSKSTSQSSFSHVVQQAKELGYTEPDPRDDLNGMDVARKVVILSRLCQLKVDLSTLSVENILPAPLLSIPTVDEFMEKLPEYNDYFKELNQKALEKNCVLRYVGTIHPSTLKEKGTACVKLQEYPLSHPFASLCGSDNIIAFTTKRFPSPLIIQGAGAGCQVTAFGMFSDLLKIAAMA